MSGVEVIGVVLGALPLLVAAFTVQHETRNLIDRLRRPERVIRSLHIRLRVQHHVFKDTAETLLREVFGEAIAHELVRDPKSVRWKNAKLTSMMKEYLAGRYEDWLAIVDEVNTSIREIQTQLEIDPDDDSSVPSLAVDVVQRLKTGFGKSKIDKILSSIESDVSSFKRLTSGARRLARKPTQRKGDPPDFKQLRVAAQTTYETISSKISCLCRSSHVLCLGLDLAQNDDVWIGQSMSSLRRGHGVVLATRSKPADQPQYVGHIEVPATIDGQIEKHRVQTRVQRDTSSGPDEKCLKSLIHSGVFASPTGIIPLLEIAKQESPHIVAVDTLFTTSRYQKGKLKIRACQKIALFVASSLLQLYETPWLLRPKLCEQIALIRSTDGQVIPTLFIQQTLPVSPTGIQGATLGDATDLIFIRNEWVFGLGLFLIELCLGETIATLKKPEDSSIVGMLPQLVEFRTAQRLMDDVYQVAGPRYGDAVYQCIHCDFGRRKYDLRDEAFCKAIFKDVVTLLHEDVLHSPHGQTAGFTHVSSPFPTFDADPIFL